MCIRDREGLALIAFEVELVEYALALALAHLAPERLPATRPPDRPAQSRADRRLAAGLVVALGLRLVVHRRGAYSSSRGIGYLAPVLAADRPYPVTVTVVRRARYSRLMPLVKWLLLVPHYLLLTPQYVLAGIGATAL